MNKSIDGRIMIALLIAMFFFALKVVLEDIFQDNAINRLLNDDLMRLVQVRDWLNGKSWFDVSHDRLGVDGTTLHWSRLVDIPIAGLILFFGVFLSPEYAELSAVAAWPLILTFIAIGLISKIGRLLGGWQTAIAAIYLGAILINAGGKFDTGSLDHHNVQVVLCLGCLAAALSSQQSLLVGIIGGVLAALSLVVGLEALLYIAIFCFAAAIRWLWFDADRKITTMGFSGAFCLTMILSYVVFQPTAGNSGFRCDALDIELLILSATGSFGLFLVTVLFSNQSRAVRTLSLIGLAAAILVVALFYAPACLSNPLSQIYPDVQEHWLGEIGEAQPFVSWLIDTGKYSEIASLILPLVAIVILIVTIFNRIQVEIHLILLALILASWTLSMYQIRAGAFTSMFMAPVLALLLANSYQMYRKNKSLRSGLIFISLLAGLNTSFWAQVLSGLDREQNEIQNSAAATSEADLADVYCFWSDIIANLNEIEPGLIVSGTNFAPYILYETDHRVLASNFHRNQDGIQTLIDISWADHETARDMLVAINAKYVLSCIGRGNSWTKGEFAEKENTLWHAINTENIPDFLEPIDVGTPLLKVFKIVEQGS
ncbi:hypothetical protein [Pseudaestuariivita rosea]|uniref:hypothetical protein n=1 Tax=Pseudaestuariivita rosea TaxID=2763263 RepID=UPI001ABA2155|nr:hypothetical protein [Pseudaestuariivita rosea]